MSTVYISMLLFYSALALGLIYWVRRKARNMKVKYRIRVGNKVREVDGMFEMESTIRDLVNGNSKEIKGKIKPEDIVLTVHEADPEPEVDKWKTVEP